MKNENERALLKALGMIEDLQKQNMALLVEGNSLREKLKEANDYIALYFS